MVKGHRLSGCFMSCLLANLVLGAMVSLSKCYPCFHFCIKLQWIIRAPGVDKYIQKIVIKPDFVGMDRVSEAPQSAIAKYGRAIPPTPLSFWLIGKCAVRH